MTGRPLLLDLFCGAGGAAVGYHRAGFDVVGVDIIDQPNYPYAFVLGHALTAGATLLAGERVAAVHASPPCQAYSALRFTTPGGQVRLVDKTRELLVGAGRPYVIENVPGAPLLDPLMLCGSHFGLGAECRDGWRQLRRHRLFESSVPLRPRGSCQHARRTVGVYGGGPAPRYDKFTRGGYQGTMVERVEAMGIDWMTRDELSQAIPPAYTEHIGRQLIQHVRSVAA